MLQFHINQLKQCKMSEAMEAVYFNPFRHSIQSKYLELQSLVSGSTSLQPRDKIDVMKRYYELIRFIPSSITKDNGVERVLNKAKQIIATLTVQDLASSISTYNLAMLTALYFEKAEAIYSDKQFTDKDWDSSLANRYLYFNFETAAYINTVEKFYFYWVHAATLNYTSLANSIFKHPDLAAALNRIRQFRLGGSASPIMILTAKSFRSDIEQINNNLYVETLDVYSSLFNDAYSDWLAT